MAAKCGLQDTCMKGKNICCKYCEERDTCEFTCGPSAANSNKCSSEVEEDE